MQWLRFSRYREVQGAAIICLAAFLTGCGEQAMVLTNGDLSGPDFELVHYGPKIRVQDGSGNVIPFEMDGASLSESKSPKELYRSMNKEQRLAVKQIGTAIINARRENFSLRVQLNGESYEYAVLGRDAVGNITDYSIGTESVKLHTRLSPSKDSLSISLSNDGATLLVMTATPSAPGEGSFVGRGIAAGNIAQAGGPTLAGQFAAVQPRVIEDPNGPPPDDPDDEEAWIDFCGLRAGAYVAAIAAVVAGLVAGGASIVSTGSTAAIVAMIKSAVSSPLGSLVGILSAIAAMLFAFIGWLDIWSNSCRDRYGSVWDYLSSHGSAILNGFFDGLIGWANAMGDVLCEDFQIGCSP